VFCASHARPATITLIGNVSAIAAYGVALVVELVGSVLLIVGFQVRIVAAVLAVFTLVTALFFHNNFGDQNQMIHFLKNVAILGGLLQVVAFGAGKLSLDNRFGRLGVLSNAALTAAK